MRHTEKKYRLRNTDTIVGYMRKVNEGSYFFSKDSFWWSGRKLQYQQVDEWTGFYDKNRKMIFELDIINYKVDPDDSTYRQGAILWNHKSEKFVICDLEHEAYFPLLLDGNIELFNSRQLEVYSYLFINPQLMEHFGIDE